VVGSKLFLCNPYFKGGNFCPLKNPVVNGKLSVVCHEVVSQCRSSNKQMKYLLSSDSSMLITKNMGSAVNKLS
jgi:hypothetical protein